MLLSDFSTTNTILFGSIRCCVQVPFRNESQIMNEGEKISNEWFVCRCLPHGNTNLCTIYVPRRVGHTQQTPHE